MSLERVWPIVTVSYTYSGDQLVQLVVNYATESETASRDVLYFTDDTVTYNEALYYYIKNLQGDITHIIDATGTIVVSYTYDAWGNLLSTSGTLASTLGLAGRIFDYSADAFSV